MANHRIFHLEIHLDSRSVFQPAMLVYRGSFYKQPKKCFHYGTSQFVVIKAAYIIFFGQINYRFTSNLILPLLDTPMTLGLPECTIIVFFFPSFTGSFSQDLGWSSIPKVTLSETEKKTHGELI